jgi:hypothetical protein
VKNSTSAATYWYKEYMVTQTAYVFRGKLIEINLFLFAFQNNAKHLQLKVVSAFSFKVS